MRLMKLADVLGIDSDDADLQQEIEICGAHYLIYECNEPYWMGEHTWHTDLGAAWQWCSCGERHAWNMVCDGIKKT